MKFIVMYGDNIMFPSDQEYLEFIKKLDKNKLRLTSGNCGIYAFALYEVFKEGKFFNLDNFCHILLERNGKYYDGVNIYNSFKELLNSRWGENYRDNSNLYDLNNIPPEIAYKEIVNNTGCSVNKEYFINIIKNEFKLENITEEKLNINNYRLKKDLYTINDNIGISDKQEASTL